jgi:drug/metabolite transporter (DMT)-like permease
LQAGAAAPDVDAVLLALLSAALFGGTTVALRPALAAGADAKLGALLTLLPALAIAGVGAVLRFDWDAAGIWPFALAGLLGPGLSQTFFTLAVRDAGPARVSVTVGTAPLFSVALALVFLDEPAVTGVLAGAVLIVGGGVLLVRERGRPGHVKRIGIAYALAATVVFATRDNLVRWLAVDTDVSPELAASATLGGGTLAVAVWLVATRCPFSVAPLSGFVPAGALFGLSYLCLFEAYYRGRVTVVSPLVATESLWGVALAALFLHRHELVGRRLWAGASLVVAGGVLIGAFR